MDATHLLPVSLCGEFQTTTKLIIKKTEAISKLGSPPFLFAHVFGLSKLAELGFK